MLFKRPLDLVGDMAENRVVGEYRPLTQVSDRVFTVELGSFYSDSVAIRNATTGRTLVKEIDYKLLNADLSATVATGGKPVDTIVFMLNTDMSGIYIDYHAVGGEYSILSLAVVILLEANKNAETTPIYWSDILDKPDTILPTNHTHELWELNQIESAQTALTKVIESILIKDYPEYREIFDALHNKIKTVIADADNLLTQLSADINRLHSKSSYLPGDIIVGDFKENPEAYYPECKWMLLPETFLYGNSQNALTDPETIDVKLGAGVLYRHTHIYLALPKAPIELELTSSKTAVDEGDNFTITVVATSGLVAGTPIAYTITGIQSADIDTALTGTLILDSNLTATLKITAVADVSTGGDERLVFTLDDYNHSVTVLINDTSKSPLYSMFWSSDSLGSKPINMANEGDRVYLQIRSANAPANEGVKLFYGGTASQADFNNTLPSTASIVLNKCSIAYDIKLDALTEIREKLIVYLSHGNQSESIVSAILEIIDTSKSQIIEITYRAQISNWQSTTPLTAVSEGDTFYAVVHARNVPNGTTLAVQYSGDANDEDFVGIRPNAVTIEDEVGFIPITIRDDLKTEGTEILITSVFLNGIMLSSAELIVIDTSFGTDTRVRFSNNSLGTNTILVAREGDRFFLIIATDKTVPDYTRFVLAYEGTANDSDFEKPRITDVNIVNNRAVVEYTLRNDLLTENDEYMRIRVYDSRTNNEVGSSTIQIVDSSRAPVFNAYYTLDPTGGKAITQTNEGTTVWLVCDTQYIPNGTLLNVEQTINGRLAVEGNGDVVVDPLTSMTISNGRGMVSLQIANDRVTDGNKPLVGIIRQGGIEVARNQITIIDTSVAEWFKLTISETPYGTPINKPILTGQTVHLNIETAGIVKPTTYYLKYVGSAGNFENLPKSIDVDNTHTKFTFPLTFKETIVSKDYTLKANLYNDPASQFPLSTSNEITVRGVMTHAKFSRLANGTDDQTLFVTGDTIYVYCTATNLSSTKTIPVYTTIDGRIATQANGYVKADVATSVDIVNGKGVFTIATINPSPVVGDTLIKVAYAGHEYTATLLGQ